MVRLWIWFERLDLECEGHRGVINDFKDFGLSYWKNGVVINEMENTTHGLDLRDKSRSSESFC